MSATINLKALGLNTQQNSLDVEPGSMTKASNVIIRRDNVVESRRGFKLYGGSFGTSTDVAKQLIAYKGRLLRHYSDILSYSTDTRNDSGEEIFDNFSGSYLEQFTGLRIKSIESNGNLYFTTSAGVQRLSARSASQFTTDSGFIQPAGGIKALDLRTFLSITLGNQVGFLPTDSTVAYRVVWGLRDRNNNLILGTPSQRSIIYNPLLQMVIRDFDQTLGALDSLNQTGSLYNDGNYYSTLGLELNASATELYNNLIALVSKLDKEQGQLAASASLSSAAITSGICTVTFAAAYYQNRQFQVGDKIYINGSTVSGGNAESINGVQTVLSVDLGSPGTITFSTTSTASSITLASANIESGWFRAIEEPTEPALPPTHTDLLTLQSYLENIINELQSSNNTREVAKNDGLSTATPLEITTVGIAASTVTVNNDAAGDARNFLLNTDLINLDGFWKDSTGSPISFSGIQTVSAAVNATNFKITVAGLTSPGVINSTSTVQRILRFSDALQSTYILPLTITTSANVEVNFTIPEEVTSENFFQIYRSNIKEAAGTDVLADLIPDDELRLVYEGFPTADQLAEGVVTILDSTPDAFILGSAYLYTNENTGEGILQANDLPPLAMDINRYQNYIFYANTSTRQRLDITLLGVSDIIEDYDNGDHPNLLITDSQKSNYYSFVKAEQQELTLTPSAGNTYNAVGDPSFFILFDGYNNGFAFGYNRDGATPVPDTIEGYPAAEIAVSTSDTIAQVCKLTAAAIQQFPDNFISSYTTTTVVVTNVVGGFSDSDLAVSLNDVPGGYGYTVNTVGQGEKITKEVQTIQTTADTAGSLAGKYFLINDVFNKTAYYVWYRVSAGGSDPALAGRTGIRVDINTGATAPTVASATTNKINTALPTVFSASVLTNLITLENVSYGPTTPGTAGTSGFTLTETSEGALDVLLSTSVSPTLATDETAQSLVRVINRNNNEDVYAYYLSTSVTAPGQILLESRSLSDPQFYLVCNTESTGASFTPDLSPTFTTLTNTAADPTVITINNHGYENSDQIVISNSNSVPSIDGIYTISNKTNNTFTIPVSVALAGTTGAVIATSIASTSDNERKPNRLYYSKLQQPDAVPLVNNIDVGAENKAILRIYPLRDSLFIFKEDGIYRLSGEVAPFSVNLFDSSAILVAPDSIGVENNVIYCWTQQGIVIVNESGVDLLSRNIDDQIFKLASNNYPGFYTSTWGVGYVSDNSYLVYTVKEVDDAKAEIAYRYCSLTKTWTTYDKTDTCGVVNPVNDNLYLGAGDINYLEVERKTFTRLDYADRENIFLLQEGNYLDNGTRLLFRLETVSGITAGDVLTQEQYLTVYIYNQLLQKLDLDQGTDSKDYYSTLKAFGGDSLRNKIEDLADKLDNDTGLSIHTYASSIVSSTFTINNISEDDPTVITTSTPHNLINGRIVNITGSDSSLSIDGIKEVEVLSPTTFTVDVRVTEPGTTGNGETLDNNFRDILACYNKIISLLNAEPNLIYKNYSEITDTTDIETIVLEVNRATNIVTLKNVLPFVQGPMTCFEAIDCEYIYTPITMGDPLSFKHLREIQILFQNKAFTAATIAFSSDLIPSYSVVPIPGAGNGIFGSGKFGQGQFGGASNNIPFRTYVSANKQRCRYLNIKFNHTVAREKWAIYGTTVTGEAYSTKAYR